MSTTSNPGDMPSIQDLYSELSKTKHQIDGIHQFCQKQIYNITDDISSVLSMFKNFSDSAKTYLIGQVSSNLNRINKA